MTRPAEHTWYRLACGHTDAVPGPHGATTGRAWCTACGQSAATVTEVDTRHVLPCEACGRPGAAYDAHGWFCQPCRDTDGGDQ